MTDLDDLPGLPTDSWTSTENVGASVRTHNFDEYFGAAVNAFVRQLIG